MMTLWEQQKYIRDEMEGAALGSSKWIDEGWIVGGVVEWWGYYVLLYILYYIIQNNIAHTHTVIIRLRGGWWQL